MSYSSARRKGTAMKNKFDQMYELKKVDQMCEVRKVDQMCE